MIWRGTALFYGSTLIAVLDRDINNTWVLYMTFCENKYYIEGSCKELEAKQIAAEYISDKFKQMSDESRMLC